MKEKLIIKNFGPLKHVELELGRFNILIGENATGKSTVGKVLSICRYFSYIRNSVESLFDTPFEYGLEAWGLNDYTQDRLSYFSYENSDYHFTAQHFVEEAVNSQTGETEGENSGFRTTLTSKSSRFSNLLNQLNRILPPTQKGYGYVSLDSPNLPVSFLQNDVAAVMDNPFYVPTQRGLQSLFQLGKNSIQNLSDSLFNQLAKLDTIARHFKKETRIEPLKITYKNVNGHGFIKKDGDDKFYSLYNAASGYQSTIPIVLLMLYYSEQRKKSKTFIIEEPELNLFPSMQNELMKYIVDRTMNYNNSILLATHSPYTLTSVNNLMYAYKVGQTHNKELNSIIDKKYWLNPNDVCAYRLMDDGTARNIIDKELSMIDTGELDEVSRSINDTWERIADLDYSKADAQL